MPSGIQAAIAYDSRQGEAPCLAGVSPRDFASLDQAIQEALPIQRVGEAVRVSGSVKPFWLVDKPKKKIVAEIAVVHYPGIESDKLAHFVHNLRSRWPYFAALFYHSRRIIIKGNCSNRDADYGTASPARANGKFRRRILSILSKPVSVKSEALKLLSICIWVWFLISNANHYRRLLKLLV